MEGVSPVALVSVAVNGAELDDGSYTVREGSVIVNLPASYMETLAAGQYDLSMSFWNAQCKAVFEVRTTGSQANASVEANDAKATGSGDEAVNDNPRTGAAVGAAGVAMTLAAAAGCIVLSVSAKRR